MCRENPRMKPRGRTLPAQSALLSQYIFRFSYFGRLQATHRYRALRYEIHFSRIPINLKRLIFETFRCLQPSLWLERYILLCVHRYIFTFSRGAFGLTLFAASALQFDFIRSRQHLFLPADFFFVAIVA